MLTSAQRAAFERAVRAAFRASMRSSADAFLRQLGNPPDVSNIQPAAWSRMSARMRAALEPLLVRMAVQSATNLVVEAGLSAVTNWSLVNTRAAQWAANYTYDLVRGITTTTRDMLRREIATFFQEAKSIKDVAAGIQPNIPDLIDRLGRTISSDVRAEMIAVTETTRAAAEGEGVLLDTIRELNPGVEAEGIWLTANDEHVCKQICVPLHGVSDDGKGNFRNPLDGLLYRQPAHPRCRCARGTLIKGLD